MTPETATAAARRLWANIAGDSTSPDEIAVAAERLCVQLRIGLRRWIGAEGYRALLDRSLGQVLPDHPALAAVSCTEGETPVTVADVQAHGGAQVAAGLVALVGALIELLGRIIGEDMAVRLVEQVGTPSPRDVVTIEPEGERDG